MTTEIAHCRDCCCARSWKALGVSDYDGMSIPEHIARLRADLAEMTKQRDQDVDRAREAEAALAEERAEHDMTRRVCRSLRDELRQLRLATYQPEGTP